MGWLSRDDILVLTLMLINTLVIICQRFFQHRVARLLSRAFVRDAAAAALREGRLDEVISLAATWRP